MSTRKALRSDPWDSYHLQRLCGLAYRNITLTTRLQWPLLSGPESRRCCGQSIEIAFFMCERRLQDRDGQYDPGPSRSWPSKRRIQAICSGDSANCSGNTNRSLKHLSNDLEFSSMNKRLVVCSYRRHEGIRMFFHSDFPLCVLLSANFRLDGCKMIGFGA